MATRKWVMAGVTLAIAGAAGFSIFQALTAGPGDVPRQKDVDTAKRKTSPEKGGEDFRQPVGDPNRISGTGIVEPADREVKVGSRAGGLVEKIWVSEGDRVQPGQRLVDLASDSEKAAIETARADIDAATARAAISALTAKRSEELARDGAISRDERDRAASQANIDRAGVDQARSRLREAQARLAFLSIKAPSAGTILKLSVREGEFYSPEGGTASLVTLGNLSKVRVRLDIDERHIGAVYVGQPGFVTVEAFNREFPGKVVEIAQRMGRKNQRTDDPTERIDTRIREVVIELDEDAKELVPGLRATGYLGSTDLRGKSSVAKGGKTDKPGRTPPSVAPPVSGGASLGATASVSSSSRPAGATPKPGASPLP